MAIDRTSDKFLLDAYTGKGGFADGSYLVAHPRETEDKFKFRQQMAVYPNFTRKVTDVYMGFLWKQTPSREADSLYDRFMANADGSGTSLNRLLFTYQRLALLLGTVYVIVDKPDAKAVSRADEALPYCSLRLPSQLVKESKDAQGNWLSVTFSEKLKGQTQYRTFTTDGWVLSKDKSAVKVIKQGHHNLKKVPVVALYSSEPLNPMESRGDSWAYDLANLNWDLYNARSELRELFRAQTFSILALPVANEKERESLQNLTISTENALTYNPTSGGKPGFIAPPPDPIELYEKHIASTVEDIYRVANMEFVSIGGNNLSGVALSFVFQGINSSMRGIAERCEQAENEIARLVYLWQKRDFQGHIAYATDFNLSNLKEELGIAMDSVSLNMGAAFDKALKKRLSKRILANDTAPKVMTEIDKEIDAQGDIYGDRIAQQANGQ